MPETLLDASVHTNLDHPSIQRIRELGGEYKPTAYRHPSEPTRKIVDVALKSAYLGEPVEFRPEKMGALTASVITPAREEGERVENHSPKVGIFFLSGAGGTGPGVVHIAENLWRESHEKRSRLGETGLVAAIGSAIGPDAIGESFSKNHAERAAQTCALIVDLLQQNKCDQIYLIGHSMGGMEMAYMLPVLEKVLSRDELQTKIGGAIFAQSSSLFKQNWLNFLGKKHAEVESLSHESSYMFPSPVDLAQAKQDVWLALEKHGNWESHKKKGELASMEERLKKNLELLDDTQQKQLAAIDEKIKDSFVDPRKIQELLKQRLELLKPVLQQIMKGAELRDGRFPLKTSLALVQSAVLPGSNGMVSTLPAEVRRKITVPVGVISSPDDVYFDERSITRSITGDGMQPMSDFFPFAPELIQRKLPTSPHMALSVDPSEMTEAAIETMISLQKHPHPDTSGDIWEVAEPVVNSEHPIIKAVEGISTMKELQFRHLLPSYKNKLERLGIRFPETDGYALKAVVIESTQPQGEVAQKADIGVFYIPGAEGTAVGAAPIAASFLQQQQKLLDSRVGMTASISQFASVEAMKGAFDYLGDPNKRAAYLAAFIAEIIKNSQNRPKELYLIATSMAGPDLLRAAPLVDELLKENGIDSKIGGLIFNQAGGMYDQGLLDFITKRKDRHLAFEDEVKMLYPSFNEFADVQTQMELAKEKGDVTEAEHRARQLRLMEEYKQNPPYIDLLDDVQRQRLESIERAIEGSVDKKTAVIEGDGRTREISVDSLLRERTKILVGLIQKVFGLAETKPGVFNPLAYAKILPTSTLSLVKTAESQNRAKITVPTAVVMADDEAYFKFKELINGVVDKRIEEGHGLFPNAASVYFARINGWAHNAAMVDPARFAGMMSGLIDNMRRDQGKSEGDLTREVRLTI